MIRLNPVFCCAFFMMLLVLSGCGGYGGGYTPYDPDIYRKTSEAPPKPLRGKDAMEDISAPGTGAGMESALPESPHLQTGEDPALPTVKVGLLLPLSGPDSTLGKAMLQAAQMAVFDIGHEQFKLLPRDTKSTPEGARKAAQSALNDGATLLLGPVFADATRQVQPLARRAGVNVISFSTDWTLAGRNTFVMGFLPFDQISRVIEYAARQNIRRIGVIAPASDYGRAVVGAYRSLAPRYGLETVDTVFFSPSSSNLAPVVRTFSQYDERQALAMAQTGDKNPDLLEFPAPFEAVLMPAGGQNALAISNLLSHYDLPPGKVQRLGTGLLNDPALYGEESLQGAIFAAPSSDLRNSFEKSFIRAYNYPSPRLATLAYDATAMAAVLARRGLSTGAEPAYDAASITGTNGFYGLDGIFRFGPGNTAQRGLAVLQIRNGAARILESAPATFQTSYETDAAY